MKRFAVVVIATLALALSAKGDEVQLVSGKKYQGAVIRWGAAEISFVLQGGAAGDAFTIPVDLIAMVVQPDGSEHKPGTESWISAGRLDRLPWDIPAPPPAVVPERIIMKTSPLKKQVDLLSLTNYSFRLTPIGKKQLGYTGYQINFPWGPYVGFSRLDFPVDCYSAGIKASALSQPFSTQRFQFGLELAFSKTLTDPKEVMTDSDWVALSSSGSAAEDRYVFSATKSTSKLQGIDLAADLQALFPLGNMLKAGCALGYCYLRMTYDIYGVSGWQDFDFDGNKDFFDELQNTNVLDYRVSYHLPSLGAVLLSESAEGLTLEGRAAYFFSVSANDEDDHLLRNKKSNISASGSGWLLGGEARLKIATLKNGSFLMLGGNYEYLKVDTKGKQTQYWYGDDPASSDDDTGYSVSGIDAKLFMYRHSFGTFAAYCF
ncbi:MAG: omptin family outer membrane protease [Candidatus Edwardsbacteria bacterium]|nr:omptin family outer membrane protease [Candidatus Edwardsbacteria bacterium]